MKKREDYLYDLAISLIAVLRRTSAGATGYVEPLRSDELDLLFQFALSNPKVAQRFHDPKVDKRQWLSELMDAI